MAYAIQHYCKRLQREQDDYLGTEGHDGWLTTTIYENREQAEARFKRAYSDNAPRIRRIVRKKQARH